MMRRWVFFITFLAILFAPMTGLASSKKEILLPKQTLVYSQSSWEPLVIVNDEHISGMITDYLTLLEKKTNLNFTYTFHNTWDQVLQEFNAGALDILPGIITKDVSPNVVTTKPFLRFNLVLAALKSNNFISDLREVQKQNLVIAVGEHSSVQHYLQDNYPDIKTYVVKNTQEGLLAVEHKKADLFLEMAPVVSEALQNSGLSNIKIVGILKDKFELVMAIQDASLLSLINQGIDAITDVEKERLTKRYIKINVQEKVDYSLSFKIVTIGIFIVIGFIVWLSILKREIRKRKLAETKVSYTNQRLHRAAEELKIAMAKTAYAHQAKSQFLANMSHEIRTPMNTIIGMTELILRKDLPEKERHYLSKVAEAGHHLLDIINDILDFSKIEANKIQLEAIPFQLEELIVSVTDLISMRAQQKGLELLIDMGNVTAHRYRGDPLRLKQILLNLVANAVKFTPKGEVIIRLKALEENNGIQKIRFEIKDTGIGITPEQIKYLFNAFSQADMSTTRNYGGTGLGLTIAQGLVLMMGGEIQCESVFGEGSTFWFEIPLHIDASFIAPTQPLITKALNVLIVDDNETALEIFSEILYHFGIGCVTCKSAKEALDLLNNGFQADVAIIDWKMEGMDGITLFQLIEQRYEHQIASIMMVTAYDKEELIAKLGIDQPYAVLVKPITASTLFDTLISMYGHKRLIEPLHHAHETQVIQSLDGITVLLVEDNPSNQEVAQELLNEVGIIVYIVNNGQEALEWLIENPLPDLILMDCQMPILDGFEATRKIRSELKLTLPIVAMTANVMKGDEERCYASGMNGYVPKPVDSQKLLQEIARFCHKTASIPPVCTSSSDNFALEGINSLQAISRLGGNAKLYRQLLKSFAKDQVHFMQTYRNYVVANDLDGAKRLCHTLKGIAGTLGMEELSALAEQAERSLHPIDNDAPLLEAIDIKIRSLSAIIQALSTQVEPFGTFTSIENETLQKLIEKLKSSDATALDDAMMLSQSTDEKLLEAFEQIKAFEFENAIALIEPLLNQNTPKKAD
ncbi:response regulator [Sulfurospirillum arsenophilum]|uniref:response regulator n=1 Tax=Sulfurospirillum arsenophilum TaxID=56698 RepID=UPI00069437E1|nr:response regulator [Sulfurospirillum arsenophilum]